MLFNDKHFDFEAFKADAAEWAELAKVCKCCLAIAMLDENGLCSYCWQTGHGHINLDNK